MKKPLRGPIEALVLAAGRGQRLRPLTDVLPKPALPLPGAPLGAWALEQTIRNFGAVAVNVSHLGEHVIHQLELEGRAEVIDESPHPFGTAGTLAYIKERCADEIFVANADVLTDLEPKTVMARHRETGATATVAATPVATDADFVLEDGLVTRFVDRRVERVPGMRFIGVSAYDRSIVESLPDRRPLGLGESVLAPLAAAGKLAAYVHHGYSRDVGTVARYVQAAIDILSGSAPPAPRGPTTRRGTLVDVAAGRAYVGRAVEAEPESIGPGAVILGGAELGRGSRVERSIVWPGERVPPGTRLNDAVWFNGVALNAPVRV